MCRLYTTKFINAISLICSIILFSFICLLNKQIRDFNMTSIFLTEKENIIEEQKQDSNITVAKISQQDSWYIQIPKISLQADIAEGTTKETMDKYIGHFEQTSKTFGNIGLAAHNRGYPVNYFANLKSLKKGDIIKYKCKNFEKQYTVIENKIIQDTDWTNLSETKENTITLITCVENEPQFRRCVIGKEDSVM